MAPWDIEELLYSVTVYYCERIQVKISRREGALREIQWKLGLSFQWSCNEPCLVLSAVRDNMCEGLVSQGCQPGLLTCMVALSYSRL